MLPAPEHLYLPCVPSSMSFAQVFSIVWDSMQPSPFERGLPFDLLFAGPSTPCCCPSSGTGSYFSSQVPYCIPNAWHLAGTQQVSLDWINSVTLRANVQAAPCHPGEGGRKHREQLLEEGSLVNFSTDRAAQRWSEGFPCGVCSGRGLVLLKGSCSGCQGGRGHLEGPFQPDIPV